MKYISLLISVALALFPMSSEAGCADFHNNGGPGPTSPSCANAYYTFDLSCATTSNVTTSTLSFCNYPAHQLSLGSGSIDYQMTVPSGHNSWFKDVQIHV